MSAIDDIAAERRRQIEVEGWTPEHDNLQSDDQLLDAAICYARYAATGWHFSEPPAAWPWGSKWWKPKDRRRDLVRAAALIAAEIDRLDRLEQPR